MKRNDTVPGIILGTFRKSPLISTFLTVVVIGSVGLSLIPPLVLERIIDNLTEKNAPITLTLAVIYFSTLAVSCLFDSLKELLITVFGQRITKNIRRAMCSKLSALPSSYFTDNDPGATVSRFTGDVDTVEALFASGIVGMFVDACKIISIISVIFIKSPGLGLLMTFVTPLLFLFTRYVRKNILKSQIKNRESVGKLNSHIPETLSNIRMIHTFRKEKYMEDKYDELIGESYKAVDRVNFYDAIYSPVIITVSVVIVSVMMVSASMGGWVQTFFGMSVGSAVAVTAYVGKVFSPLESIGTEIQSIQSAVAGVRRITDFLSSPERRTADASLTCEKLKSSGEPAVVLHNVTFGYNSAKVLRQLSFRVDRGENVTLAGRTGSGKSTVIKLLLGLYEADSGDVLVFGANASGIPDSEKRKIFGYVEQSFRSVSGTVGDQISVYDKTISREAVINAAKLTGLHGVIISFPQGYDTVYSESLFSQGQRQLLSIARAVAADPSILLLDEITANLDSETEGRVLDALNNASINRTVISVSHRLYEKNGGRIINIV